MCAAALGPRDACESSSNTSCPLTTTARRLRSRVRGGVYFASTRDVNTRCVYVTRYTRRVGETCTKNDQRRTFRRCPFGRSRTKRSSFLITPPSPPPEYGYVFGPRRGAIFIYPFKECDFQNGIRSDRLARDSLGTKRSFISPSFPPPVRNSKMAKNKSSTYRVFGAGPMPQSQRGRSLQRTSSEARSG